MDGKMQGTKEEAVALEGWDAEFLAKRLGRVARLVGVPIPENMTYEQVCGVAGTLLGQIAGRLESAAPSPLHSQAEPVAWADDKAIAGGVGNVASAAAKAHWEQSDWADREIAKRLRHPLYSACPVVKKSLTTGFDASALTTYGEKVREAAATLHKEALEIFVKNPMDTPQETIDVIEWFLSAIRSMPLPARDLCRRASPESPQSEPVYSRPSIETERAVAEQQYTISAFDYEGNPVGSRDWTLYWAGWLARSTASEVSQASGAA